MAKLLKICVSVLVVLVECENKTSDNATSRHMPTEQRIHDFILTDYSVQVKPVKNVTHNGLGVSFELKISKINYLDIKKQELSVTAFTLLKWHDNRLIWNASEYDEMERVNLANDMIWTPDVVLYNDANVVAYTKYTDLYRTKLQIENDGLVVWNNPVTWVSACNVDATWFPVDKQVCNITFGSWSYNAKQLKLSFKSKPSSKAQLNSVYHIDSGEWSMAELITFEENQLFSCCKERFSTITYQISLTRYPLFYFIYIFLPLISQLFLFLMIFHIPPDTGERLGFGITILLNITMYMNLISEKLPENSNSQPMLGTIFVTLFYLLSSGLAISVCTLAFSRWKTPIPDIIQRLFFRGNKTTCPSCKDVINPSPDASNLELSEIKDNRNRQTKSTEKRLSAHARTKEDNQPNWINLTRSLDRAMFYVFLMLLVALPAIICGSLNTDGLGL